MRTQCSVFKSCQSQISKIHIGCILKSFNANQEQSKFFNENKLGILQWDMKYYDKSEQTVYNLNNDIHDNIYEMLKKAVATVDEIDWEYFYKQMASLRLSNYYVRLRFIFYYYFSLFFVWNTHLII